MRPLSFDVRSKLVGDGTCVVAVAGEADLYNAPTLEEHLRAADATGIVVDLTEATFIDSTTIGVLVEVERKLRSREARMALVVTEPNVARVFAITALDRIFAIHSSRAQALAQLALDGTGWRTPEGARRGSRPDGRAARRVPAS